LPGKKEPSVYDFLNAKLIFTHEPLWFRIVISLIAALCMVGVIWALHEWALPTLAARVLFRLKVFELLKIGKSRSP